MEKRSVGLCSRSCNCLTCWE